MTCETWEQKLDAYLDAELPEAEAREIDAHLRSCASCSSQALVRSELKRTIHLAGKKFVADPEFRKRMQSSISSQNVRPEMGMDCGGWRSLCGSSAGDLRFMVWVRQSQRQQLVGELTDLHVATLASANRVDVVSSDRHTVKPWFQGKVPFTFNVPELQGSPFELLGGKVTYLDQTPGAELLFTVRKHVLSVFIFKDSPELDRALGSGELLRRLSFSLESWTDGGLRYVIITDAGRSDIDDLRARFVQAAQ